MATIIFSNSERNKILLLAREARAEGLQVVGHILSSMSMNEHDSEDSEWLYENSKPYFDKVIEITKTPL